MKKIAVINDLSGFGKCSLTAALPIISALGVQCCPLATGVFSNQTGYDSFYCRDMTDDMPLCVDEWKKLGAEFDGILTGFVSNERQGKIIADFIDDFKTPKTLVTVDPVMADDGEVYKSYNAETVRAVIDLVKKADLITPNLTELCIICGEDYSKISSMPRGDLLEKIKTLSAKLNETRNLTVVTSGIEISDGKIANAVFSREGFDVIVSDRIGGSFSGTGDILSAFVTARRVNGTSVKTAVEQATDFIFKSVKAAMDETDGACNRMDGVYFEKYLYTLGNP